MLPNRFLPRNAGIIRPAWLVLAQVQHRMDKAMVALLVIINLPKMVSLMTKLQYPRHVEIAKPKVISGSQFTMLNVTDFIFFRSLAGNTKNDRRADSQQM